ncbi:non-ribosomal peptide synthase/polyketide synthase [Archangium violaceum]|uniref:non-ribosomal peptide synthetase n=1 Tax=Archangium violaceum TaxID=83451 RepID=UPI001950F972|nr:non-ribosomal peptide synthetase [Archangium violaceum]QRN94792.1 non-ribosomal peptide synthase/polyketide synthase [Archangium violaceum]
MSDDILNEELRKRLAKLPAEKRELLMRQLRQKSASVPQTQRQVAVIERQPRDGAPLPLSFAQQRLWFLDQLEPGQANYNVPLAVRLEGALDLPCLQRSFDELVRRHEALRTTLRSEVEGNFQLISPPAPLPLAVVDLRSLPEGQREAESRRLAAEENNKPFDLERGPLLRATLMKLSEREHVLVLVMHHIVSDGWSMGVLVREMAALYAAFRQGQPSPLPELSIQYADYAVWQRRWLQGETLAKQLTYWKQQLSGAPTSLELPTDRPRPAQQSQHGSTLRFQLPRELSESVKALGQAEGATPFMTLLAAFQVLMHRHSGQDDILIGSPIAGRHRAELEGLIGFFVNTLVLRARLGGNPTFREFLRQVKETTLGAQAHQDVPFEKLVEELRPDRDLSRTPLFQVLFTFQNRSSESMPGPDLMLRPIEVDSTASKFDLGLTLTDTAQGLSGLLEYKDELFDASTVRGMMDHLRVLLEGIAARPDARISELPLLSPAEHQQLLRAGSPAPRELPRPALVHRSFEAQALRTPDAPAVRGGGQPLSYRQLNERANQLARHLRRLGVGPDVLVAVCLERTPDLVVAQLATLKAGGAYLPLDPSLPRERLDFILSDAGTAVLLTHSSLKDVLSPRGHVFLMDEHWSQVEQEPVTNLDVAVDGEHLAYVIYTSGSTGRPKGTLLRHAGLCNTSLMLIDTMRLRPGSRVLQFFSAGFDASVSEIWPPLLAGAEVVLASREELAPGAPLMRVLKEQAITVVTLTPSVLAQLEPQGLEHLETLFSAGEACTPDVVARWKPGRRFINAYGPTETTICATRSDNVDARRISIGQPYHNVRVYVLDANLRPVPVGVPGELFIGGAGLARGYLGRPELTAERFIPDALSNEPGARLYRTGDQVRWLPDGTLEYLGRIDFQVKVRGYRIELGEIESVLARLPQVREAVVLAREDVPGNKRLVAYVVAREGQSLEASALKAALKEQLPEYMVPSAFVTLEALPLTSNGKVDRKALPAPDASNLSGAREYVAPRSPVEQTLADVWAQVLRLPRVGIHDNFFELGGDSIISLQIIARARQAGLSLSARQLFQHQTIAELASVVRDSAAPVIEQGPVVGPVPLTPIQRYFLDKDSELHHFNQSMAVQTRQPLDVALLEKALRLLVSHHDALRLSFQRVDGVWRQRNASMEEALPSLLQVDLSTLPAERRQRALLEETTRLQSSFSLSQPPLLRAALFHFGEGQPQRLFITAHHLVVDVVSWRVLLEDLESIYQQLLRGQQPSLPAKTTSFQSWAQRLEAHARSAALEAEAPFWLEFARRQPAPLPTDASGPNTFASEQSVSFSLDAEATRLLLQEVPSAWRAHINDVLLSALAQAVREWTGQSQVLVDLEGHGRQELFSDVDLSRTVGWFTSSMPVLLELPAGGSAGDDLRSVRDTLRRIPHNGVGFGLLRYLGAPALSEQLAAIRTPQIGFNYLGQLDATADASSLFSFVRDSIGPDISPSAQRFHALEVGASVVQGRFGVTLSFSTHLHQRSTIESLAQRFLHHLRALIDLRHSEDARRFTPSDFPLARLPAPALDTLLATTGQDIEEIYPLSPLQQGMLFHYLLAPESAVYFEQTAWTMNQRLDLEAFRKAWQGVLDRNPILRTSFHWKDLDAPLQVVHTRAVLPFEEHDWRGLSAEEQRSRFERFLAEDRQRGFLPSRAPLMRVTAIRLGEDSYRFLWSNHHLLLDGWSLGLIIHEVFALYDAFRTGSTAQLPSRPPFRDYIAWMQGRDASADESFWRSTLAGLSAPTPLPSDTHAAPAGGEAPSSHSFELELGPGDTSAIQAFARQHQLTLNTLAQASWALVLSRYSGESDVVFGTTVAGRPPELPGSDNMMGLFINTLPVRVSLPSASSAVLPWLKSLQDHQLQARQYEYSSLVQLQALSGIPRGNSLFESLLVVENYPLDSAMQQRTSMEVKDFLAVERTNYPLTLAVLPGDHIHLRLSYEAPRFESASMQRLLAHWRNALVSLVANASSSLGDLSLLSDSERAQVVDEWNATGFDYPRDACIHQIFEQQAALRPDAIAVEFGEQRLTYRQLDERANQLAHLLRSHGVGPDSLVALCLERSAELMPSLLGILKAGGAYLPLDAAYPQERLAFMLQDSRPRVLLTTRALRDKLPATPLPTVLVEELSLEGLPTTAPVSGVTSGHLAYVIYTSGSTGTPKGVAIEHRSVMRLLHGASYARLGPDETFLLIAPISFDASILELWGPLLFGSRLVVFPASSPSDLDLLSQVISRYSVTTLHLTSGLFSQMVDLRLDGLRGLRQLLTGGDVVSAPHVRRALEELRLPVTACYGPTESTLFTSCWRMTSTEQVGASVPIGRPISNTQVYVLDSRLRPLPVGVPGELFIGGDGLARGYLGRPELTAERFIPNPFGPPGSRLYRTGDLARWRSDGVLDFLGRLDNQVKVRGFRIELGEVESALLAHPSVREAIALVREDVPGDKRLVAYVVAHEGHTLDSGTLRSFLQQRLPEYMLPSAFVALAALPLTANAKVDRKALPAPEASLAVEGAHYVAPRTPTEEKLAAVWAEVLRVPRVGATDSFFELGGHSLLATQVTSRIRAALGVELPLRALFAAPTLEALARRIDEAARGATLSAPRPVSREQSLPLSFSQQRLWFLDQLEPDSALYNMPTALRLEGPLDLEVLERCFTELVRRHEALRTTFQASGEAPTQVIAPPAPLVLARVDLGPLPAEQREAEALRLAEREARRPFNLKHGPLLRVTLLRLTDTEHVLVLNMHHIVSDGWSMTVLVREMAALYDAFSQGKPSPLPELPVQYADFAVWQRQWLQGQTLENQLTYWKQQLAGTPGLLELPTDKPRPPVQTFNGTLHPLQLPRELSEAVNALCQREGVTPFMLLLATYQTLLHRYSGQDDIVVGSPIGGRRHTETEGLIGFFVNTLVLRARFSGGLTFRELLRQVKETTLGAHDHQDLPFEKLVEELQPERDLSHSPLFQVWFVLDQPQPGASSVQGLTLRPVEAGTGVSKFDLTLSLSQWPEGISGAIEYNTDLFDASTIERMAGHLRVLLENAVARPDTRVADLPLLPPSEHHQILGEWNAARRELPQPAVAHRLFEAQARRTPDAIAVRAAGGEHLTYAELNERANQLARHLRRLGVGPDVLVAVCLERTPDLVVAMLAILKAGGAWLPLDPSLPAERLDLIATDAWAPVLITDSSLEYLLDRRGIVFLMDEHWSRVEREPDTDLDVAVEGENLAYVIYTSGSTGRPKGTLLRHAGLCNTALLTIDAMRLRPGSRVLQFFSVGFDASVWEIWPTLLSGGELLLAPREELMPGAPLTRVLKEQAITAVTLTPSVLAQVEPEGLEHLETIVSAGEACTPDVVARWKPGRRFINAYGPTETTICATLSDDVDAKHITIGRTFHNVRAYVLDAHLQPVPVGVPGELCIGGVGLARGYLGRPELTAERFAPDAFSDEPGARLYRTGDQVRWLPDGNIEYLGRVDFQVKVRGYRIEPGEIESELARHPSVREAVVVAREDVPGNKRLVAYVVANEGQETDTGQLRGYLKQRLPEYMVPSAFVHLEKLPLSSSGKVDREALPAPGSEGSSDDASYIAPRTPMEQTLATMWSELLGLERVSVVDNFFDMGGHSLLATQVASRIRANFGVELPLRVLFEVPTLEGLATRLESILESRQGQSSGAPPLTPADRTRPLPLSFAQQRLWFLDQLEPGGIAYNMPVPLRLEGPLDLEALQRAFDELVRRHESLRTTFRTEAGEPVQLIAPSATLPLAVVDLSVFGSFEQRETEALRLVQQESLRPFDLTNGPLLRALLLKLDEQEHVMMLVMHHIISDGWSLGVFVREMATLYEAFRQGQPSPLPELSVQYADFAVWQRQWLQGETLDKQLSWWKQQLSGAPQALELPTDRPRPAVKTTHGAVHPLRLSRDLSDTLKELCQREGVTPFMLLLAAFQAVLHRYSGQEDIVVGSPIAGRHHGETEGLIGFFINTLVLRARLGANPTFRELLHQVKDTTLGAYEHQDIPFEKLVEELQPARDMSRTPLFQVMFVLQNTPISAQRGGELSLSPIEDTEGHAAKFDLTLNLGEVSGGFGGVLEYNTDLFDAATAARLAGHFRALLEAAVERPDVAVSELNLLTEAERHQLLVEWNDTAADSPRGTCFHQLFEAQVDRTPEAVAVVYENDQLTYRELDSRANALAWHLRSLGVGPEVLVGLYLERSVEALVGMLGILKAGGAYVPLDPTHPGERVRSIIEDASARVLVTQRPLLERLAGYSGPSICLDTEGEVLARQPTTRPPSSAGPDNLVYAIFTSGSTGRPKGVAIEHRQLVNYLWGVTQRLRLEPGLGFASISTLAADLGNTAIFPTLCHGGTLHLLSREQTLEPAALGEHFERHAVEGLKIVPTHLWAMLSSPNPERVLPRRRLVLGGDRLDWALVDRVHELAPECEVFNHYGPTETTVGVLTRHVPRGGQSRLGSSVPLGRPIPNVRAYLLDEHLQPVPIGVPGELYFGGDSVGRGYLGRSDLTAERFIPDPFGEPGARMYRTGDRARYLPDGSIEFLGRADHQLKIRGYRVELGEIEAVVARHPAVRKAVVVAREDRPGDKQLVAYLLANEGQRLEPTALRTFLKEQLPEHMVPSAFVQLESFPFTANGKLDRKALPVPEGAALSSGGDTVAPRTEEERRLADIWARVLRVPRVGVRDNFFELGGHSLLAVRLMSRIREATGHALPLATLFQAPTVEQMASLLRQGAEPRPWSPLVPFSGAGGARRPFFCVHPVGGNVLCYAELARQLGPDQPFYGLQAPGLEGGAPLALIEEMAACYIELIRTVQPTGPYLLGGWSLGGVIAYEMARQLERRGEQVEVLALIDSLTPAAQPARPELSASQVAMMFALDLVGTSGAGLPAEPERLAELGVDELLAKLLELGRASGVLAPDTSLEQLRDLLRVFENNLRASRHYEPVPYGGPATLFLSSEGRPEGLPEDNGWRTLVGGGLELHALPGNHYQLLRSPTVERLAGMLKQALEHAHSRSATRTGSA